MNCLDDCCSSLSRLYGNFRRTKAVEYENSTLGSIRAVLYLLAFLYVIYAMVVNQLYLAYDTPVGAVTFGLPNASVVIDTSSETACGVLPCLILQPDRVLHADSKAQHAFVNTRITYTQEVCEECTAATDGFWVETPDASRATSLYSTLSTTDYYVAGVESMNLNVQHGGWTPRGFLDEESAFYGTSKTMDGELLDQDGENLKDFKSNIFDQLSVSDLLEAADVSLSDSIDQDATVSNIRYNGAVFLVELQYYNQKDFRPQDMAYIYRVKQLPDMTFQYSEDVPNNSSRPYGAERLTVTKAGLQFIFQVTGQVGRFDFFVLWSNLVVSAAMFCVAAALFEFLTYFLCCPNLKQKWKLFNESAVDLFVYSASTSHQHVPMQKDTYMRPLVEMSTYQRKKRVQRQLSRNTKEFDRIVSEASSKAPHEDPYTHHQPHTMAPAGAMMSGARKPVPIGTKIRRDFPGYGVFDGTVVEYKKPFYRVVYPDGDAEQLTGKELRPLIVTGGY